MDLHSGPGSLSFFNLQIELLVEGMPDADKCSEYKYHEERGFRESYFTPVNSQPQRYLASASRDIFEILQQYAL